MIVPVLNAARHWAELTDGLRKQTLRPDGVLIIDSSSTDGTRELAEAADYRVVTIQQQDFHHGATRQLGATLFEGDWILIYLTQDAYLANEDSLAAIVRYFDDPKIGAAFGRQLPHTNARPQEAHARYYNYPDKPQIRDQDSIRSLGFKAIFSSDSFAAYRSSALQCVGGFPKDVIVSEETVVFAKMLLHGWKTAYAADALVYHSHWHTLADEFRRYFDIGVLHSREPWLLTEFGNVSGEGRRYVLSLLRYLLWGKVYLYFPSMIRTVLRVLGYRAGRLSRYLSRGINKSLSQQPNYWK